jgi:hypothetical protein
MGIAWLSIKKERKKGTGDFIYFDGVLVFDEVSGSAI